MPTGREPYGNGVPIVVRGRESHPHGEGGRRHRHGAGRYARCRSRTCFWNCVTGKPDDAKVSRPVRRGRPTEKCFGQPEQLAAGPPYHHNCRVAGLGRLTGPATIQRWYCLRSSQTHLGKLDPTTRAGVAHPSVGAILPIGVSLSSAYRPTAHEWLSFWCRLENRYPAPFPEPAGRRMS